jgi:hypothetical protein
VTAVTNLGGKASTPPTNLALHTRYVVGGVLVSHVHGGNRPTGGKPGGSGSGDLVGGFQPGELELVLLVGDLVQLGLQLGQPGVVAGGGGHRVV